MVPSTFSRLKAARCLPVVLAALIFAGCGTHTPDQSTAYMQGTTQADSAFYLQQMQQSSDDTRINWQLLAIRALVKEGKTGQAVELFNQLPQELNDSQRREKTLLAVEIKLAQKDFAGAQNLLAKITPADLEQNQQARYWQAKIDASQGRPSIDLLRALIAQEPLLGAKEKQQNIDATWQALSSMTQEQANTLVINADENILQGWLDLQRVWFDNRNDPDMMKAGIADWQKRYPNNPGAKMLPTQLVNVKAFKPASTNKIALLLPLNGQAAVFGRTIQQGFEAAKNIGTQPVAAPVAAAPVAEQPQPQTVDGVASPAQASVSDLTGEQPAAQPAPVSTPAATTTAVSAPANPSAELKIYDTSSQPLSQILSQVQQDGASIVVGPLLKNNVEELLKSNTPLNVLALNQPENIENRVNICYFALSPEDEARDAARHIRDQGKQAPLVLIPRSSLGDRVANAFAQEWQKLGGGTVLQQKFGSTSELRAGVNGGSGIALTGTPITPRATTDDQFTNNGGRVDAVYIVATPGEIAFIKPMIAMRNGSQSGATLYASSRSAQGTAGPDFRLEMEGLQYSEIPMLAGGNLPLMQQALSAVNNDYSLARMYAMGVDAWSLANHFSQMRQVQGFEINGNTGSLTANPDCVINRKLSWLQYQQGQVVPAS
ncbi:penicillin-binding protein activator [Escherichia coli]|uniref:penicillin-binding protein activator LpoA n=1 Tax=Escherichia coli TaxID=562 RepID=UPI0010AC45D6|nr:penicillin-binding protein activator LpoA [Escherichia coli]TJU51471.1 penicillin-binding protein activator [Escherichia coli]